MRLVLVVFLFGLTSGSLPCASEAATAFRAKRSVADKHESFVQEMGVICADKLKSSPICQSRLVNFLRDMVHTFRFVGAPTHGRIDHRVFILQTHGLVETASIIFRNYILELNELLDDSKFKEDFLENERIEMDTALSRCAETHQEIVA
jgi:hypothetical protein